MLRMKGCYRFLEDRKFITLLVHVVYGMLWEEITNPIYNHEW